MCKTGRVSTYVRTLQSGWATKNFQHVVHLHATWSIETLIIMLMLLCTGSKNGVIKEISQGKLFVVIKHKQ